MEVPSISSEDESPRVSPTLLVPETTYLPEAMPDEPQGSKKYKQLMAINANITDVVMKLREARDAGNKVLEKLYSHNLDKLVDARRFCLDQEEKDDGGS